MRFCSKPFLVFHDIWVLLNKYSILNYFPTGSAVWVRTMFGDILNYMATIIGLILQI